MEFKSLKRSKLNYLLWYFSTEDNFKYNSMDAGYQPDR